VILVDTNVLVDVLADFFIGAHAATMEVPILTRDIRRYSAYFPTVETIAPVTRERNP
jgi:predicted nucleic acid-binding protein